MRQLLLCLTAMSLAACADSTAPSVPAAPPVATPTNTDIQQPSPGAAGSGATMTTTNPAMNPPTSTQPASPPAAMNPSDPMVMPPARDPGMLPPAQDPAKPADMNAGLAMDECGLKTQFPGDEYCIKPPPADKGFQLHIGPGKYDSPEQQYMLQPGEENVVTMSAVSGNTSMINYYYRQYRMRPGSHHVILSSGGAGGRRLGGTQNLAKDNPDRGIIPPENQDVGLPLAANTPISVNMHYYNVTSKPIIREVWVNFWYKDAAAVKQQAKEVFSMTGVSAAVAHSHVVVGASCPITGSGRILSLYGHRHLNNVRFSAYRVRGGQRELVLDDFDPEHPSVLEYNSITKNPLPDAATKKAGGYSGMLELKAGDSMEFECEIINNTDKNFRGLNEASDDEMCILVGDTVGTSIPFMCSALPAKRMTGAAN